MRTVTLIRPKRKERYYDESNMSVYINGKLVAKLGQDDSAEITIEESVVEIDAKISWARSEKMRLEVVDRSEIEIVRKPPYGVNPAIWVAPIPILSVFFFQTTSIMVMVIGAVLTVALLSWILYCFIVDRKRGVSISVVEKQRS